MPHVPRTPLRCVPASLPELAWAECGQSKAEHAACMAASQSTEVASVKPCTLFRVVLAACPNPVCPAERGLVEVPEEEAEPEAAGTQGAAAAASPGAAGAGTSAAGAAGAAAGVASAKMAALLDRLRQDAAATAAAAAAGSNQGAVKSVVFR